MNHVAPLLTRARSLWPQPLVATAVMGLAVLSELLAWLYHGYGVRGLNSLSVIYVAVAITSIVVAYRYPIHMQRHTKVLLTTLIYYVLAVLIPAPLAALTAGIGAAAGECDRRVVSGAYVSDIASEVGRRMLVVFPCSALVHLDASLYPSAFILISAALLMAVLDLLTLPLVMAPMTGEAPHAVLLGAVKSTILPDGLQYLVGLIVVAAALQYPWTLLLLIVPAALLYRSYKVLHEMHDSTRQLMEAMADAVDLRDTYTGGHSRRVTAFTAQILAALNLRGPEYELVLAAARVHDVGKIGIPDAILLKPAALTPEEQAIMQAHSELGATLLQRYRDFARGVEIVRHHHENWDGTGYPQGLAGTAIPFGARVVAVADSFDAMTSDRPYRKGMPREKAMTILRQGRGKQWDAAIIDAFLQTLEEVDIPKEPQDVPLIPTHTDDSVTAA